MRTAGEVCGTSAAVQVSAAKAPYAYVKEQTHCPVTAAAAYKHAVAQAAHDRNLDKTHCELTATAAYEQAEKQAEAELADLEKASKPDAS